MAGLHVKNQRVALADQAYIVSDNITSGLMGLAYSALTSEYVGTNTSLDNQNVTGTAPGDQEPYSPIVQTMIAEGLNPAVFSLAMERAKDKTALSSPGGYIAFGGLPPVAFDPIFSSTPLEIVSFPLNPCGPRSYSCIRHCTSGSYVITNTCATFAVRVL